MAAGEASRMKRYGDGKTRCTECREVNTKDPSGVCSACRTFKKAHDFVAEKHEAVEYIPRPDGYFLMDKPCTAQGMWRLYDRPRATPEVRALCQSCPAHDWCLAWGVGNPEHGVWGGLGVEERRAIRKGLLTRSEVSLIA